jgi:uncharacterized protein YecE (DUF72 family)
VAAAAVAAAATVGANRAGNGVDPLSRSRATPVILVGTSGYNYPEWKGSFYPQALPASKMLPFYAARFPSVEINATFYRMPTASAVAGWVSQVPPAFRFTLKANRRITHDKRLKDVGDAVDFFVTTARGLGPQLGALLFQTPPNLKCDLERFDAFLPSVPDGVQAAFEFRHDSWLTEEVYARLRARNLALCVADTESRSVPIVATADFAYLRLRDEGYDDEAIVRWTRTAQDLAATCRDVFVYFKHEDAGKGAVFGQRMLDLLAKG